MRQPFQFSVHNRLLSVLAGGDFDRLASGLKLVKLTMREILIASHEPIAYVWFPESGLVSLLADSVEGRIEIGMVGSEGIVGVPVALGAEHTPHVAMVQAEGAALRIAADDFRAALEASPALRLVLGRYVHSLIVQVGQTVQANVDLNIEGRLARWVLMTQDRLGRDELPLTHEFLATMLGVRRPGITVATQILESTGMIRATRGRITVLNREMLKKLAGDSYGSAETEHPRPLAAA